MAALQGVLWDMDGVLVDTGDFHFQSWSQVLSEYHIHFTLDLFKATFGMNNHGLLNRLSGQSLSDELIAEISDRKESAFRNIVKGNARLLPGVVAWLVYFQALRVRQAVASSAPQENIDLLVNELGIRKYFQLTLSAEHLPGKPDPAVFLLAARQMSVPPEGCLVIEDAIPGVEAARRAGMKCLAVTTTNPAEKLRTANMVVDHLEAVKPSEALLLFGRQQE